MKNSKLEESVVMVLQGKLNESKEVTELGKDVKTEAEEKDTTVELNGRKMRLFNQDEVNWFEAIKRTISHLEKYVTNFNVNSGYLQNPEAYVEFKTADGEGAFVVEFDPNLFGKVKSVQTTFSNQNITTDFIKMAEALYELKK